MSVRLVRNIVISTAVAAAASSVAALPAQAASRLGERTLERGDNGADVRELQRTLSRLKLRLRADGAYGRGTERAVRRYERRVHISKDGRVSPGQARGMRRRAGTLSLGSRTLRRGNRGRDVRRLQELLTRHGFRVRSDGVFGAGTERRLKAWESDATQTVDGRLTPDEALVLAGPQTATTSTQPGAGGFFPIAGKWKRGGSGAGFGDRGGAHQGVDLFADCGTPLVAPQAGQVVHRATQSRAGNYVVLRSADTGEDHVFMHLRNPSPLEKGAAVTAGQNVGVVGKTGNASACHLHFEIWTAPGWYDGGAARDPQPDLNAWARG